jgi:hypothetical protein
MKMKKLFIILIGIFVLSACDTYLDKEYDASLSEEKVFTSDKLTREFLTNIYTYLPNGLGGYADPQYTGASFDVVTDNAQTAWPIHVFNRINNNTFTSDDNPFGWYWANNMTAIRKCNVFIENSNRAGISNATATGDDNHLLTRYNAEARLMRAIYHFWVISYFGDAPIITKAFSMENQAEMNMHRTNAADALKWVADECDSVKTLLPFHWVSEGNWGRVNGAVALALKSRALLYRASPLFNKGNDATWWTDAANAAQEFMTANNASNIKYGLYTGSGATSYGKMFYILPFTVNEFILNRSVWNTTAIDEACVSSGFTGNSGRVNPSKNLVDAYETTNGKPIGEDPTYKPTAPYSGRDPRLGMTIFYNGTIWGNPTSRPMDMSTGGLDMQGSQQSLTGYYLKKWCSPDINYTDKKPVGRSWVIFRYAEILLNYAEAMNEKQNDGQTVIDASIYSAINTIRSRAGLVNLPGALSKEQMRARIHNERRVEFAFEDHRYLDVRRWRIFDNPIQKSDYLTIRKTIITKSGRSTAYKDTIQQVRNFEDKNYFFPIPYSETIKAPNLGQNIGW